MTAGFRGNDLSDDILAVFQRACRQGRLDVAEHLLRALEVLCETDEGKRREDGHSAVDDAYRAVAGLRRPS
ncbi:hypothetical protein ACU4I5_10345 [Ensifer adhaerens]